MEQRVLLFTRALPTRLALQGAFDSTHVQPVISTSPGDLLSKIQHEQWDAIVLDGDSSPIPLSKLLEAVGAQALVTGTAVVAVTSQAQVLPPESHALLYDRPIRPNLLLGAMNRLLLARGKRPIMRPTVVLDQNMRRALRVPLLVPVAFRAGDSAWQEGEIHDVSIRGAKLSGVAGVGRGQDLGLKNLLSGKETAFRVVWVGEELEGAAAGLEGDLTDLRFWWTA